MAKRIVLAGRLDRGDAQDSLTATLDHAGALESILVYGRGLLIDLEVEMLAESAEIRDRGW